MKFRINKAVVIAIFIFFLVALAYYSYLSSLV